MNSNEIIILSSHLSFADSTKSTFKRFLNDVIDIVNNVSSKNRDRKIKYRKNVTFASLSFKAFYNFTFFVFVTLFFRQERRQKIRRFARFASRVFSFFQFLSQEENDDHDFDDFFFIRSYVDFVDHDLNQKFEHVSNNDNDEKKKSRLLNRRNKRTYAKKIVRQRIRVRKTDFKIRRDDKSLNSDYMIARKKNVIFDKHVLSELHDEHDKNACSFCDVYQYFEKCHRKFIDVNIDIVASTTKSHRTWWFLKQILTL